MSPVPDASNASSAGPPSPPGSFASPSSPSAASAVSDRDEVHVGEPFHVALDVRHAPEQRYALASSQPPGPFEVLRGDCVTRSASRVGALDGTTRCEVDLALLDLGRHSAVLRLEGSGPSGSTGTIEVTASPVQALPVTNPSLPASAIALRGMPQAVPLYVPTWTPLLWIAAFVAVVLTFAVVVVRRVRARLWRAEQRRRAEPRVLSPSEAFEERLDALAAPSRGAEPPPPEAFFELSRALRSYLAELCPGASLARTSAELLAVLRRRPVGGLDPDRLAALTAALDQAKYTGAATSAEDWRRLLAAARGVLESTRPPRWHPDREARSA